MNQRDGKTSGPDLGAILFGDELAAALAVAGDWASEHGWLAGPSPTIADAVLLPVYVRLDGLRRRERRPHQTDTDLGPGRRPHRRAGPPDHPVGRTGPPRPAHPRSHLEEGPVSRALVLALLATACSDQGFQVVADRSGGGDPEVAVWPDTLDFGSLGASENDTLSFQIRNVGEAILDIGELDSDHRVAGRQFVDIEPAGEVPHEP